MEKKEKIIETYPTGLPKKIIVYEKEDTIIISLHEIAYWDNGNIKNEKKYNSPNDYKLNDYYKNGQLKESIGYLNDQKSGTYSKYLVNGTLLISGHYSSDLEAGIWKHYDEDGKQIKINNFLRGREILEKYPDGTCEVEKIWDSSNHYIRRKYYLNGSPMFEFHQRDDDMLHGLMKLWHEDGQLEREVEWINGAREGKDIWYHENGEVSSITYCVHDIEHGEYFSYYDNGQIKEKGVYDKGGWGEGERVEYKRNGKIKNRAVFKNGKWTEKTLGWIRLNW